MSAVPEGVEGSSGTRSTRARIAEIEPRVDRARHDLATRQTHALIV
ncbi:MAG: hypothetical protein QOK36_3803, partial [Gaiellales bacterium]|nr:hypothetical protein [Gaiellales bacterium]